MTAPSQHHAKKSLPVVARNKRRDSKTLARADNSHFALPTSRRPGEGGTILVEALVAVLIVCAISGALFETIASKASISRQVELRRTAVLVARSQLAAAMAGAQGPSDGDADNLHWSVVVEPFDRNARSGPLVLDEVRVTVTDPAEQNRTLLELRSLRPEQ